MRQYRSELLSLLGLLMITISALLLSIPLGVFVGGVVALLIAKAIEDEDDE